MADENTTIVIKKIKKAAHAHHGGAWKVAYADFVTAMMAFFLLLWLLSSTSKAQKEGIAEYFTPTVGLKDAEGIGFKGGTASSEVGIMREDQSKPGIVTGAQPQGPIPDDPKKDSTEEVQEDAKLFEKAEAEAKKAFFDDPSMRDFKDNVVVEQSPEGLKLSLIDDNKHPMFNPGQIQLSEFGQRVLTRMAKLILKMPNYISISGHTDSSAAKNPNYTNWELSADRANATRRFLLGAGLEKERTAKVVGLADREPLLPDDPTSDRNRRITIILLRGSHMNLTNNLMSAPRSLLSGPQTTSKKELILGPGQAEPVPAAKPGTTLKDKLSPYLAPENDSAAQKTKPAAGPAPAAPSVIAPVPGAGPAAVPKITLDKEKPATSPPAAAH